MQNCWWWRFFWHGGSYVQVWPQRGRSSSELMNLHFRDCHFGMPVSLCQFRAPKITIWVDGWRTCHSCALSLWPFNSISVQHLTSSGLAWWAFCCHFQNLTCATTSTCKSRLLYSRIAQVFVIDASKVPPPKFHNRCSLMFTKCMNGLDTREFVVVWSHSGSVNANLPSVAWWRRQWRSLPRKYRKNLHRLYILHPSTAFRMQFWVSRLLLSRKFFANKLVYISTLPDLYSIFDSRTFYLPRKCYIHDAKLRRRSVPAE